MNIQLAANAATITLTTTACSDKRAIAASSQAARAADPVTITASVAVRDHVEPWGAVMFVFIVV